LNRHAVDRYLDVVKPLGIDNPNRVPYLKTTTSDDAAVEALLKKEQAHSNALLVGLFVGAGHVLRRWPIERYAALADFLIRNDRVRVIVFAGPEERWHLKKRIELCRSVPIFPQEFLRLCFGGLPLLTGI
jgi:ADP-heptose:LPS heptosyltransferase